MELDYETLNKTLAAAVPAVILAIGAFVTAKSITSKIEKMKLDAQAEIEKQRLAAQGDLEKQRMEYQASLERERMAFQRESESQKQRMERYKILFEERINVSKELMKILNDLDTLSLRYAVEDNTEVTQDVITLGFKVSEYLNMNNWLLSKDVVAAVGSMQFYAILISKKNMVKDDAKFFKDLVSAREKLAVAISEMMLNDDLSEIMKKGPNSPPSAP